MAFGTGMERSENPKSLAATSAAISAKVFGARIRIFNCLGFMAVSKLPKAPVAGSAQAGVEKAKAFSGAQQELSRKPHPGGQPQVPEIA
jgi:hypothetical protein